MVFVKPCICKINFIRSNFTIQPVKVRFFIIVATWLHGYVDKGYVATWLHGYTDTWLKSYVATWLHGYTATWLKGYVATWLHGYTATWLRGYTATWLRGYKTTRQNNYNFCSHFIILFQNNSSGQSGTP